MTRIEPDSHKITRTGLGEGKFLRSTVLRAIDEEIGAAQSVLDDVMRNPESTRPAYVQDESEGAIAYLRRLRARFQPTEGD